MTERLVVAYPGRLPATTDPVEPKLLSGMLRYQASWPGEVVLAAPGERPVADLPFEVVTGNSWSDAVRRARPDLLLAPLVTAFADLADLVDRTVLVAEFAPSDLQAFELSGVSGGVARARVRMGSERRRQRFDRWVRRARGVQCNGYPAHDEYASRSPRPLLFLDTRLTAAHVAAARRASREAPHRPAHLCFSGRLVGAKGPAHAVAAVERLRAEGHDVRLTVLGAGPLADELAHQAGPGTTLAGSLEFAEDWTSFVRDEVDLMVLPHVQGDPSGTYLEAAGCGAPVVGFDNVALAALVERHRIGWTAPLGETATLAARVADVLADPTEWRRARTAGLDLMEQHDVDTEFARRIDHLRACA